MSRRLRCTYITANLSRTLVIGISCVELQVLSGFRLAERVLRRRLVRARILLKLQLVFLSSTISCRR